VREHDADDALEIVARAIVTVDAPPPDGFRLPGFLRDGHEPPPEILDDDPVIVEDVEEPAAGRTGRPKRRRDLD
jgi:hypothetical protein